MELTTTTTTNSELSHLPSIMTRTSRQQQQQQSNHHNNNNSNHHHHHHHPTLLPISHQHSGGAVSKPAALSAQAIGQHTLAVRTNGFADLAFIDYSSELFPFVAAHLCELWPRHHDHHNQQPLHKYKCAACGFYFPCQAALDLHALKRRCSSGGGGGDRPRRLIPTCDWFMTNSKTSDYERCIDEIITRIEIAEERQQQHLLNRYTQQQSISITKS